MVPVAQTDTTPATLSALAREIETFTGSAGWDQAPQLFALVPTETLLAEQPDLAEQIDNAAPFTPVAQDELPTDDLAESLAQIEWPATVHGAALMQEIVILPPEAQEALEAAGDDAERFAVEHPDRREARLVAVVHKDTTAACVLRLRAQPDSDEAEELVEDRELAPNLVEALLATFDAGS